MFGEGSAVTLLKLDTPKTPEGGSGGGGVGVLGVLRLDAPDHPPSPLHRQWGTHKQRWKKPGLLIMATPWHLHPAFKDIAALAYCTVVMPYVSSATHSLTHTTFPTRAAVAQRDVAAAARTTWGSVHLPAPWPPISPKTWLSATCCQVAFGAPGRQSHPIFGKDLSWEMVRMDTHLFDLVILQLGEVVG